jgi:hypothetical protein
LQAFAFKVYLYRYIVAFFAGSLTGVTAPMWEVEDEAGKRHEFTSAGDAKRFKGEVSERARVKQRYGEMKKKAAVVSAVQSFRGAVVSHSGDSNKQTPAAAAQQQRMPDLDRHGEGGGTPDDVVADAAKLVEEEPTKLGQQNQKKKQEFDEDGEVPMAFDCYASIGVVGLYKFNPVDPYGVRKT